MAIRDRISRRSETFQDVALACEQRFWEGLELLTADRQAGGVYLLGYVAEMILKIASFTLDGAAVTDRIDAFLPPVRRWASNALPGIDPEGLHSIRFWCAVYQTKRNASAEAPNVTLMQDLSVRAKRLHGNWIVDMRYVADQPLSQEVLEVYDDVSWIRDAFQKGLL